MTHIISFIQILSYYGYKGLDSLKHKSFWGWVIATILLLAALGGMHFGLFGVMAGWLKEALTTLIVLILSAHGARTTSKLAQLKPVQSNIEDVQLKEQIEIPKIDKFEEEVKNIQSEELPDGFNIVIKRYEMSPDSTISDLYIGDQFLCKVLEDPDRGLSKDMPLKEIEKLKIYGDTAIPYGTYQVVLSYSGRFKKLLPEFIGVPGYTGVRFHPGNTSKDTKGCPLPIMSFDGRGRESTKAFNLLFRHIKKAMRTQKVFVTIQKADGV